MDNSINDTIDEQPSAPATGAVRVGRDYDQTTGLLAAWSLGLGIASMFLYQLILLPLGALVLGMMAVGRNDPGRLTGKWRAVVGLILGILYSLLALFRLAT